MTPLVYMLWAPRFHFPWSGAVSQDIDPDFDWFAREIRPGAGDADIERRAFRAASYGTQLGLITDVLLEQAERLGGPETPSLRRLRALRQQVEVIKAEELAAGLVEEAMVEQVVEARGEGGLRLEALAQRLLPLLAPVSGVTTETER